MAIPVTAEGRTTIPDTILKYLGISPGDKVEFRVGGDGRVLLVKDGYRAEEPDPEDRFERLRGIAGPGPSTDEIMRMFRGEPDC